MNFISNPDVATVFDQYPSALRHKLMQLRQMILDTAAEIEGVGKLEETLKWGEPAYITLESKSGSTIRIDRRKSSDTQYAMYFNCQTTLVDMFRTAFPNEFRYEGNRAIIFEDDDNIPVEELKTCIAWALTYHRGKRMSKRQGARRS